MRILHVADRLGPAGGVETYLDGLLGWLAAAGHRQALVCGRAAPGSRDGFHAEVVVVPGLADYSARAAASFVRPLLDTVERFAPDVCSLHTAQVNPGLAAALAERVPTIFHAHNAATWCPGHGKYWERSDRACRVAWGRACYAYALRERCADRRPWRFLRGYRRVTHARNWFPRLRGFVVGSNYMREALAASGVPRARVHLIPYAIPLPAAAPPYDLAISGRVLFAGRVTPQKGLLHLVRALGLVRCPWSLVVNGDGYALPRVRRFARAQRMAERIRFRGWTDREQLEADFQQASVVAVPSVWPEPFGLVGPEALGRARPVVAFRAGGIPEWLEDGVTGRLAGAGDVPGLARALEELLRNRDRAAAWGRSGRAMVEVRCAPGAHTEALVGLYASVQGHAREADSPRSASACRQALGAG